MIPKEENVITVGLFGTCGTSTWRDNFIAEYTMACIPFFNPLVPDWNPSYADIEAQHLVEDEIILFPVTDETYGAGSLAEVGFSIAQAIRSNDERFVVIYVAPKVNEALEAEIGLAKESNRARALTLAHLKKQKHKYPNVYIVDSLNKMLEVSIKLYESMVLLKECRELCS